MAIAGEWKIPQQVQPRPKNYDYDLAQTLAAVVGLHVTVPSDAFTAETLGTERAGHGVLIDDGLVLTIGYLITEAETVWLHLADGHVAQGHALGFDSETGFGLVQALTKVPQAPPGRSRRRGPRARSSPDTGSMCSTRRSSPRPRIPIGAARH